INADGAVRDVDAVATEATEQREKRRRRVAEDAGLAVIMFIKIRVARPQEVARVRLARVLLAVESGVDVESVFVFMEEREVSEEIEVLLRNRVAYATLRLLPPRTQLVRELPVRVLAERLRTSDRRVEPEPRAFVEKVEKHLLVVAAKDDDVAAGRIVSERENVRHGAGYVLAAVNEVSEQDECVP